MMVNNNLQGSGVLRNQGNLSVAQKKEQEKLASGKKINRAADDAAGLAISNKLLSELIGSDTASSNAQSGISMVQTADAGLSGAQETLQRMRELTLQAGNAAYGKDERAAIQQELNALKGTLNDYAKTTQFNGQTLLDGNKSLTLQVGGKAGDTMQLNFKGVSADALGVANLNVMGGIDDALKALDGALKTVAGTRSELGAAQNGLESTVRNLDNASVNALAGYSRIADADMARSAMNSALGSIQSQFSIAVQAQSNSDAASVLSLIS